MCIYLSVFSVFVCIRVRRYILFVYIYVHVYAFRVCVYFICLLGVFVRIFIWVCIRILCVMYSWVFLVVASSSLFASLVLPSVLVYWFIDLLIYCYTFLLVLVVSIGSSGFYWFLLFFVIFKNPQNLPFLAFFVAYHTIMSFLFGKCEIREILSLISRFGTTCY